MQLVGCELEAGLADLLMQDVLHFGATIQSKGSLVAISEPDTHSVLVLDDSADSPKLLAKLGGHGKDPGQLIWPSGIDIDQNAGVIYVSDSGITGFRNLPCKGIQVRVVSC
jgi:hypothetical protein